MSNSAQDLQEQIAEAFSEKQPVSIQGGGSKHFYGCPVAAPLLDTTSHTGIIAHEPTELTITVRCGTTLAELDQHLEKHGQVLACEPPDYSGKATVGGMIAAGLAGPARPYLASVQDTVLGCTLLNGKGERLGFGGKVMKNVAGYDISRLIVGSLGCLGLILDVTLKVIPRTLAESSFAFSVAKEQSAAFVNELRKNGLPVTASCFLDEQLVIRFAAGNKEIENLTIELEKHYSFIQHSLFVDDGFWLKLRNHQLPFFSPDDQRSLWRLSVSADTDIKPLLDTQAQVLTEWGGVLHWMKTDKSPEEIFNTMSSVAGQASLFRTSNAQDGNTTPRFQPLPSALKLWHKQLKAAFDPAGILNPGKMYPGL